MIKIHLEGMSVAKQSFRATKNGFYKDPKVAKYQSYVASVARIVMADKNIIDEPCFVSLTAYFAIKKSYTKKKVKLIEQKKIYPTMKPDCDNLGKGILDSLNKIVYKDDSQIVDYRVSKRFAERDYVTVEIMTMEELKESFKK